MSYHISIKKMNFTKFLFFEEKIKNKKFKNKRKEKYV